MKDKTITVRVPDFCPEDCPEFKLKTDVALIDRTVRYSCEQEYACRRLYEQFKTRYYADCRDAMLYRCEVVRCKNCKHAYQGNFFRGYGCNAYGEDNKGYPKVIKDGYGFCDKGEARGKR